jgi:hypothetical protein
MRPLVSLGYDFTRCHAVLLGNAGQMAVGSGSRPRDRQGPTPQIKLPALAGDK